jgi:hypothetical protein
MFDLAMGRGLILEEELLEDDPRLQMMEDGQMGEK